MVSNPAGIVLFLSFERAYTFSFSLLDAFWGDGAVVSKEHRVRIQPCNRGRLISLVSDTRPPAGAWIIDSWLLDMDSISEFRFEVVFARDRKSNVFSDHISWLQRFIRMVVVTLYTTTQ